MDVLQWFNCSVKMVCQKYFGQHQHAHCNNRHGFVLLSLENAQKCHYFVFIEKLSALVPLCDVIPGTASACDVAFSISFHKIVLKLFNSVCVIM